MGLGDRPRRRAGRIDAFEDRLERRAVPWVAVVLALELVDDAGDLGHDAQISMVTSEAQMEPSKEQGRDQRHPVVNSSSAILRS